MPYVDNKFPDLLKKKEAEEDRRIPRREISRKTGISLTSVQNWAKDRVTQFQHDQIVAFCQYFNCSISDLLVLVEEDDEEETALLASA